MSEERNWGAEPWRAPALADGDTLVFDECGRIINKTDYRSHYLRLVRAELGGYFLLVKHGGGEERVSLGGAYRMAPVVEAMTAMTSDARYLLLSTMLSINGEARRSAAETTAHRYREAFVSGALKKRKQRGSNAVRVWIEG